jgi:hypothetical protein
MCSIKKARFKMENGVSSQRLIHLALLTFHFSLGIASASRALQAGGRLLQVKASYGGLWQGICQKKFYRPSPQFPF